MKIHKNISIMAILFVVVGMALVVPASAALQWQTETVNDVVSAGQFNSLAFNSTDNPAISYYDRDTRDLMYAHYDGDTWQNVTVDETGDVGWYTSLVFDGDDNPMISYNDRSNTALKFASYDGSKWNIFTVDNTGDVGQCSSLDYIEDAGEDFIGISYSNGTGKSLKYAELSGDEPTWMNVTVDATCDGVSSTSFAFDSTGRPSISYYDAGNHDLKYAYYEDDTWKNETVASVGYLGSDLMSYHSLAFDNNDNPCISCAYSGDQKELKYFRYDGADWQEDTVDTSAHPFSSTSLAFDTDWDPAIGYINDGYVKYASYNGTGWEFTTIPTPSNDVDAVSLAIDTSGNPGISYDNGDYEVEPIDLFYAYGTPAGDLNVKSIPSGATIVLDGVSQSEETNTTLTLPVKTYAVTVEKDGYVTPVTQNIGVTNGDTATATFSLVPQTGNITVTSVPSSAWVWIDGANTTQQTEHEFSLPVGEHNVTVQHIYYDTPDTRTFTITDECALSENFTMEHQYGNISVSSVPEDAWIYLDGINQTVQTNTTLEDVEAGAHNVTIQKDMYTTPLAEDVTVTDGATEEVAFTPTPLPPVGNFTATPLTGTTPLTVQFTDTSTGINVDEWTWDFGDGLGDGSSSSDQNPVHTYTTAGTYNVTLIACNPGGFYVEVKNNLITVTDPTPTPTPAPTQVIHRGGGGGGNSQFAFREGTGVLLTSSEGKLLRETTFTSGDGIAKLTLAQNTIARNSDGEPLPEITIGAINASDVPENLNGAFAFAGFAYQCTPSGATFEPAITLSFTLSTEEWNALDEDDFTIRYYDEATGEWVELPATVNAETHTITAEITHFSIFGLFTGDEPVTTTAQSQPDVTPVATVPADTTTGSEDGESTSPEPTQSAPLVCVPLFALGALAILRKRL